MRVVCCASVKEGSRKSDGKEHLSASLLRACAVCHPFDVNQPACKKVSLRELVHHLRNTSNIGELAREHWQQR